MIEFKKSVIQVSLGKASWRHLQTKAFLLTRSALCAERPRSRGGFLRFIKLVARFDLGVAVAEVLGEVGAGPSADGIDLLSSFGLALRENRFPLGVTAGEGQNLVDVVNRRSIKDKAHR